MCDYCDCRSEKELAELSEDHARLLDLLDDMERFADRSAADGCFTELATLLRSHAAREERGVFEQLRLADLGGYVSAFEGDHARLDALVGVPLRSWTGIAVAALLRDLIRREESDLFPAAHQNLASTAWHAIEATRKVEMHDDHDR